MIRIPTARLISGMVLGLLTVNSPSRAIDFKCGPEARKLLKKVVAHQGVTGESPLGFNRTRSLLQYLRYFPPELGEKIAALGPKDLILDAGAGS